ncbi:hypothetical protein DCC39_18605 [Pueribacillus theae]|uniref:DUF1189 domain-containing protein n=1 Tax=Pueribacillus theae TaxID=2171751 RepID=A0A2U1JI41_9BACI|nr:DUF1189 family protein [Pueribacillus theae]PWA04816.1 hypothetical protein DCC39_18605 [Pueribacillus theae]
MSIFQLFVKSLYSLKSISLFRFQKIEKTISYLFFLSFLVSLPSFILFFIMLLSNFQGGSNSTIFGEALYGFDESQIIEMQETMSGMIPVFIFLSILFIYLAVAMLEFITVSLIAGLGLLFKKFLGRKLNYKQLWLMSAYSATLPSVLIGFSTLLPFSLPMPYLLYSVPSILILFLAIRKVPIPKKQRH